MREMKMPTQPTRGVTGLAIVFLFLSLAFAVYLYPLPDQNIAHMTSTMTPAEQAQVTETLESSYWASWMTNLLLLLLGACSATLWLMRGKKGGRKWPAISAAIAFVLIGASALVLQSSDQGAVAGRLEFLRQLMAARAWSFLAAEMHRLLAVLVALATAIMMALSMRKNDSA